MKTNETRAEITWSLMHPTPLDADYMRRVVDRAAAFRVDSFEVCAECHNDHGGLEGIVSYDGYEGCRDPRDPAVIERNRQALREILDLAHASGRPLFYWHREVMVPRALAGALPGLLDADGEFDLLGPVYEALLRFKIRAALSAVPALDGLVLTLTESDYSVIHNSRPDRYPPAAVVAHLVRIFAGALSEQGKRFILRSFGSVAQDYEDLLAGAAEAARAHPFEVETKITPYDFVPFLPVNPWLRRTPGTTLSAECDCVGEFLGAGHLPAANAHNIVGYVREAQKRGVDRFAIRLDRRGTSIFDTSYEVNLEAYQQAIDDPAVTADDLLRTAAARHGPAAESVLAEHHANGLEVVQKTNFISGNVIFHTFPLDPSLKWVKAGGILALFKEGVSLEDQAGIWSLRSDRQAPADRGDIVREKEQAHALARRMLAAVTALQPHLPPGFFERIRDEWAWAVGVSGLYGAFCRVVCAYMAGIEQGDAAGAAVDTALTESRTAFAAWLSEDDLAAGAGPVQEGETYHGLFRPGGRDLRSNIALPLWRILCALREEYPLEWNERARWLARPGVADFLVCGAASDEWRIARFMHASHARCANGRLSRQVGNTVFPNGFIAFDLERPAGGGRLRIETRPDPDAVLRVALNREPAFTAGLSTGEVETDLPPSGPARVRVQLSKEGRHYPEICSAGTLSPR